MKLTKYLLAVALGAGLLAGFVPGATADGKKLTCCEKAALENKECTNRCCIMAHRQGKSCEKCNPNQEDLAILKKRKAGEAKKADGKK